MNVTREKKSIRVYIQYLLLLNFLFIVTAQAQQYPQFTQYTYNMNIINPAYAGFKDALNVNVMGRTQWVGVEGAPKTGTLGINTPLGIRRNFGIGFSAIYNELGPLKETHLYGDVAYKMSVSNNGLLSFGLKFGASIQSLNQSLLRFNTSENFTNTIPNKTYANLGFGLFFSQEDFYVSLSLPNILSTNFFNVESTLDSPEEVSRNSTVFLGGGYVFTLSNTVKLKPAMMFRYSSKIPVALDISSSVFINDKIEFGISHRIKESIALITALNVNKNIRIGYSYDFSTSNAFNSNGSHEILLLYSVNLKDRERGAPIYY
ncbi:type IX secretion system membrane protein PorP/SprF [uncultured Tenacibaculum sp.]|uniref:PorP/SprF family type IX secretion system membrane protein n=1 Tax=uncultured Tenacibaculum sp. TaxID=174713 RepID=UPI0026029A9C|nr:type IX secretion system membrane protein PorP/SprF [uncultured Tenacibaculum sp.]